MLVADGVLKDQQVVGERGVSLIGIPLGPRSYCSVDGDSTSTKSVGFVTTSVVPGGSYKGPQTATAAKQRQTARAGAKTWKSWALVGSSSRWRDKATGVSRVASVVNRGSAAVACIGCTLRGLSSNLSFVPCPSYRPRACNGIARDFKRR